MEADEILSELRAGFELIGSPLATASDEVIIEAAKHGMQVIAAACDAIDRVWQASTPKSLYEMLRGLADISEVVETHGHRTA